MRLFGRGKPSVEALARAGDVPRLVEALADDDVERRREAAVALGRSADSAVRVPLLDATRDPDSGVRSHALSALRRFPNDPAVCEAFLAASADPERNPRESAIQGLAELDDPRARSRLLVLTSLADPDVRRSAQDALAFLDKRRFLEERSGRVQRSLKQLVADRDVAGLVAGMRRARDLEKKCQWAEAVGRVGGNQAVGPLLEFFTSLQGPELQRYERRRGGSMIDRERAGRDLYKRVLDAEARIAKALRGKKLDQQYRVALERRADLLSRDLVPQQWDSQHEVAPQNVLFPDIAVRKRLLVEALRRLL